MIILPDKNIPRSKFLMPMQDKSWRVPSRAISYDKLGNLTQQTRFRIRAKTHDGVILWCGFFDDRADFDAFLWAIQIGSLPQERPLWDLPTPMWPGLDPGLVYDFASVTFFTGMPGGVSGTYNKPIDWNDNSNSIEAVGAGGGGGGANAYLQAGTTGGGGGGYGKVNNFRFPTGISSLNYQAGGGGDGGNYAGGNSASFKGGLSGGDSWFGSTSFPTTGSAVGGRGGSGGIASIGASLAGGAGGSNYAGGGSSIAKYIGGKGGDINGTQTVWPAATGGGGAGGYGNGGAGTNTSTINTATKGGNGGGAAGGAGGLGDLIGSPQKGNNGTYWDSTHGVGGGGGGSFITATAASQYFLSSAEGGSGGTYGGGGGAGNANFNPSNAGIGGLGADGIIVITYAPVVKAGFNMPMLGM